jgi:hypothetical protein
MVGFALTTKPYKDDAGERANPMLIVYDPADMADVVQVTVVAEVTTGLMHGVDWIMTL